MINPSIPAQYVLILIDMVAGLGYEREILLANTGLAERGISGIGARVSEADFNAVVSKAMTLTGDPALGLHLGLRLNLSAHALLGQAFMTCRDLAQVMELLLRYHPLLAPNLELAMDADDERCSLTVLNTPEEEYRVFYYELLFSSFLNTLRGLLSQSEVPLAIDVPYPPPQHEEEYRRIFGDSLRFDCIQGSIAFPASLLATPLPLSNPALRALYEEECARLLADLQETGSTVEHTLRLLRKLEGQYPQMPQLAKMLNLSPRTYRRRLASEQQSFQLLLDQVRAEHATRYLKNTRLSLTAIADLIGFNDTANFRRAYLKWTGRSPGEVRREH